jgi:HSP20 family protein
MVFKYFFLLSTQAVHSFFLKNWMTKWIAPALILSTAIPSADSLPLLSPNYVKDSLITRNFKNYFDGFFDDFDSLLLDDKFVGLRSRSIIPVDIKETKDFYEISADFPGIEKDNIRIEIDDGILTLSCEKENSKSDSSETYTRSERYKGSVSRSFQLPNDADEKNIEAVFKNGVLTINVKKLPEPKMASSGKIIKIK